MLSPSLGVVLALLAQQPGTPARNPRWILEDALFAVEADTVGQARVRWSRLAEQTPPDRSALLGLGSLARVTYDYQRADSLLDLVVALRGDDAEADYARLELGRSLAVRGRFREAADVFAKGFDAAARRADTTAMAEMLLASVVPRSRLASPAEVTVLLDRAGRLTRGFAEQEATLRCHRAVALAGTGALEAINLAGEGAELAWRVRTPVQEGRCWHAMAQAYMARGNMEGADTALGRALGLFRRTRDSVELASVFQRRGHFYLMLSRYGESQARLAVAIAGAERTQAASVLGYALINKGAIALGVGDRRSAIEHLDRAVALFESQGDEAGKTSARTIRGHVARGEGDLGTARAHYTAVLDWADGAANVQTQLASHRRLGSLAEMSRDWPAARREYELARGLARANGMTSWENSLLLDFGRLALASGDFRTAERELQAFLPRLAPEQHRQRYDTRALLAESYVRRGDVARGESELIAASDELDGWRASLTDRQLRVRALETGDRIDPDLGVATVIAALAQAGRVESAFRLADRRRARDLTDEIYRAQGAQLASAPGPRRPVLSAGGTDVLQAVQDDETALLEYVTGRGGEPTTLFVATRRGIAAHLLAPIDSLQADLLRFATVIQGGGDARPLGKALAAALLQPGLDALDPRVTRLVIVPDDILARVAYDALVLADGRYAVERFTISLAPSASTLVALRSRPVTDRPLRLLAFGDPQFAPLAGASAPADPNTPVYRDAFSTNGGLPRLVGSGREARRVARYGSGSELRLGSGASEAFLRTAAVSAFRVLHFATHALVDEEAVTRTALALAPGGGEDGFLGAADLAALNLDADLVVLSACRTAGGVVLRGEGIQGLTAPLLQAGARSVVATGWRIADESAGRMVEAFYTDLASGNTVGGALRTAKLNAIRAGAPPGEWAAFVAVGDPMVRIPLIQPGSRWVRAWLAAGAALLLAFAYWMRKRSGAEGVRVPSPSTARTDHT